MKRVTAALRSRGVMESMDQAQISSFWESVVPRWALSEALFLTAKLRIADVIGDDPTELDVIAHKTRTNRDSLRRLLNALVAHGIFKKDGVDRFGPTPLSNPLRSDTADSQRAYIALGRLFIHDAWTSLESTLQGGHPAFDLQFGAPLFEYLRRHSEFAIDFAEGMTCTTRRIERALMAASPFGQFDLVIDIGGSFGSLLRLLLAQRPLARGIVFDRPEIADAAALRWAHDPDTGRLQTVGGNFFESVPQGGDLYLLKQILHDWSDDECAIILRNVRKAMPPHGRVAIVEMVLPEHCAPHPGWLHDLLMMTMTGGRERTAGEYEDMLAIAGFEVGELIHTSSALSVIQATPTGAYSDAKGRDSARS
jgi:hypothetical protein